MNCSIKKLTFLFCPILLFLAYQTTHACSCAGTETACSAYSSADAVFVGTVTKTIGLQTGWFPNRSYVRVGKVYKGAVPKQVIFPWGTTSCDVPMQAGETWLLYASKGDEPEPLWYIGGCGRSRQLQDGNDDIKYLESSHLGKKLNRLSGSLYYPSGIPIGNADVEIEGVGEKRRVRTDDVGFFDIYGLDPGSYEVGPSDKGNWWGFRRQDGAPFAPHEFDRGIKRLTVKMEEASCVETGFRLEADNYIKGEVTTEDGTPVTDVCVNASMVGRPVVATIKDCVNEDGVFLFSGVPSGKYILWAESKTLNRPWAPRRFPPVYFPNSFYRAASTPVTVTHEDSPEIRIVVPNNHPLKLLKGTVVHSDGSFAAYEQVSFTFHDGPEYRSIEARSDKKGAFNLPITEGLRGRLVAEGSIWTHETEKCSKLRKYRLKEDFSYTTVESNSYSINVRGNRVGLILKLPYSKCPETS